MANYAWAENAAIIKDNGSIVTYHPKCPYCGTVHFNVTSSCHVGGPTNAGTYSCYNCGKSYTIRLGRN